MSFYSFRDRDRDKPRLSERIRGKSGDELFKELRKELDQDRKLFFDSPSGSPTSNWGSSTGSSFPRAGHLFDDPLMRGSTDIKTHLEDLAHRHPEFADQLRYPAWSSDNRNNTNSWGRKRQHDAGEASKQQQQPQPQQKETSEPTEDTEPARGRPKENLSNTVPDMGQKQQEAEEKESRGKRSWSAPPDNRTQAAEKPRFVSKIEIHPVNPDATYTQSGDATKPPMAPPKPQPQQHQQPQSQQQPKQSNVRHIPIFVEGRDEPILPKNIEPEFTQSHAPPPQHFSRPQAQFTSAQQHYQPQSPPQQHFEPPPQPKPQPPPPQKSQQQPQPPPVNPRDPLYRVGTVQKEVDELKDRIENFNGNSRSDKEYILLDELLTRNLIKLDDVETEGKEQVRAARKNTIKSIQRCISILENKVPVPGGQKKNEEAMEVEQGTPESVLENPGDCEKSTPKQLEEEIPMEQSTETKPSNRSTELSAAVKPEQQSTEDKLMDTDAVQGSNPLNTEQPSAEEKRDVPGEKTKELPYSETLENKSA